MSKLRQTVWVGYRNGWLKEQTVAYTKTRCLDLVYQMEFGYSPSYRSTIGPIDRGRRADDLSQLKGKGWRVVRCCLAPLATHPGILPIKQEEEGEEPK